MQKCQGIIVETWNIYRLVAQEIPQNPLLICFHLAQSPLMYVGKQRGTYWRELLGWLLIVEIHTQSSCMIDIPHHWSLRSFSWIVFCLAQFQYLSIGKERGPDNSWAVCWDLKYIHNPREINLPHPASTQNFVCHKLHFCTLGRREEGAWGGFWNLQYMYSPCAQLFYHTLIWRNFCLSVGEERCADASWCGCWDSDISHPCLLDL